MIPSFPVYAITEFSPEWLTQQLQNIYGSALVGLWIGEDVVVDAQGNITSWPGRAGPTLVKGVTSNLFKRKSYHNRIALTNPDAGDVLAKVLTGTLVAPPRTMISVANAQVPFNTNQTLMRSPSAGRAIQGLVGTSNLYSNADSTNYVNSLPTITVQNSGINIFEVYWTTQGSLISWIGGYDGGQVTWEDEISCCIALSTQQTPAQRIATNYILKKYYKIPISASEQLAYDLIQVFPTQILGLWIGDDYVVSGNNVTYLANRGASPNLTQASAVPGTLTTVNGRQGLTFSAGNIASCYSGMLSAAWKSGWAVCEGPSTLPATVQYNMINVGAANGECITINSGTSVLVDGATGWTNYINGITSVTPTSGSLQVIEGEKSANTGTTFNRGYPGADLNWPAPGMFHMALNAVPTATQRIHGMRLLKSYYSIPHTITPQEQLAEDLGKIHGTNMVGLWIPDDVVTDVTGSVTSLPARQGEGLFSRPTAKFTTASVSSRTVLSNAITDHISLYVTSSVAAQDWLAVAKQTSVPSVGVQTLFSQMTILNAQSAWLDRSGTEYTNGIPTLNLSTSSLEVYEYTDTAPTTIVQVGGLAGVELGRAWQGQIGLCRALVTAPTGPQRIKEVNTLKRYYSIPLTDQDILAEGLVDIYGSALIGLWIGEDIVTDVTGSVTSWPGRSGDTLTRHVSSTGNVTLTTIDGRTYVAPNTGSVSLFVGSASGNVVDTCCVAQTNVSIAGYRALVLGGGGTHWIMGVNADSFRTNSGMTFWQDGTSENYERTSGKHILEAQKPGDSSITAFNYNTSGNVAYQASADVAFIRALKSGPTTLQRAAEITLLKTYYGIS